jgi:hypothetical protein
MHGHNRLTDNNKTTNDREDEVVGIYCCRSRNPYVVAEVVVVVIVVVEFILTVHAYCRNVIVVMAPELTGRPLCGMCTICCS